MSCLLPVPAQLAAVFQVPPVLVTCPPNEIDNHNGNSAQPFSLAPTYENGVRQSVSGPKSLFIIKSQQAVQLPGTQC